MKDKRRNKQEILHKNMRKFKITKIKNITIEKKLNYEKNKIKYTK